MPSSLKSWIPLTFQLLLFLILTHARPFFDNEDSEKSYKATTYCPWSSCDEDAWGLDYDEIPILEEVQETTIKSPNLVENQGIESENEILEDKLM